jgi:hypothetical protein
MTGKSNPNRIFFRSIVPAAFTSCGGKQKMLDHPADQGRPKLRPAATPTDHFDAELNC